MGQRLLIVSTLDYSQPFGAFTRPFYLGQYLVKNFDVFHVGLNCSEINYAPSISVNSRSLIKYTKVIMECIEEFQPDIIYAQETLPSIAALIAFTLRRPNKCSLFFDFHTFSAFEYWSRLSSVVNPFKEFIQLVKTYIAQGILVFSNHPIIAAGNPIIKLVSQWYRKEIKNIYSVGNGVAEDLLNTNLSQIADPYQSLRPAKIVAVVAPKTYQFPSNDMSVLMTIEVAKYLEKYSQDIQFIVIGREADTIKESLSSNIKFVGFLPERKDFIAHIKHADIGLLPFPKQAVAGGARNKALDYFASNKLVISTAEGLRGLEEFRHLEHVLITGYSVEEVADVVLDAALNLDKYQPLVKASHQLILENYSWNAKAKSVAQVLMLPVGNNQTNNTKINK